MKTAKKPTHTPGPWKIGDVRSQSVSIETVETHHVESMDAMTGRDLSGERAELIARAMNGASLAPGVGEANARLIASAPMLREAVREVLGYLNTLAQRYCDEHRGEPERVYQEIKPLRDALRAALEQAEAR